MATHLVHCGTRIVTLAAGERIATACIPDDIALIEQDDGWWVHFVADAGESDTYDAPFPGHKEAMWAAKAAAEFNSTL